MRVIGADVSLSIRQTMAGWGKLALGPGAHSLDNSLREPAPPRRWWPRIYATGLVVAVALATFGAWRMKREALLPVALMLYFVLLSGGPEANSRFRTPAMPMLAVLAVAAFTRTEKR
jgi:hypothetical protein